MAPLILLVAPFFDDIEVEQCLAVMRHEGIPLNIVSTQAGLVRGQGGLLLCSTLSLRAWVTRVDKPIPSMVILPGSRKCLTTLLSNPLVFEMLQRMLGGGAVIATLSPFAEPLLASIGLLTEASAENFILRRTQPTRDFLRSLSKYVLK